MIAEIVLEVPAGVASASTTILLEMPMVTHVPIGTTPLNLLEVTVAPADTTPLTLMLQRSAVLAAVAIRVVAARPLMRPWTNAAYAMATTAVVQTHAVCPTATPSPTAKAIVPLG